MFAALRSRVIAASIVAALLLIYALVGFFLVPRIARSHIEGYVADTLQRKVTLGEIRFNPFFFDASVGGATLRESDDSPLASLRHLYINAELASLWHRAIALKEVELSAPDVQLVIAPDGAVNLAKLAPQSQEPQPAAEAGESAPPRVHIGRLTVTDGRVGIEDRTRAEPFTAALQPIRFTLTDFRTDLNYRNAYRFAGTTTAGEHLEWSGAFTVQPLGSTGSFRISDLQLATIDSYLYESLPFRLASGQAHLRGDYRFDLDPFALDLRLPSVTVRALSLSERTSEATAPVSASEVDMQDLAFSFGKREVGIKRIGIRGAHVDVAREADGTISLSRLSGEGSGDQGTGGSQKEEVNGGRRTADGDSEGGDSQKEEVNSGQRTVERADSGQSPAAGNNSSDWSIHADTIQFDNASVLAEDRTVSPVARFELTPIAITVSNWSTQANSRLQLAADMTIDQSGKLTTTGEVQLEPLNATLAIDLNNFALPAIQPWLASGTAMTLRAGALSAKGDLSVIAATDEPLHVKFSGAAHVADLRTTDQFANQDFVKWRNLAVTGIVFQQNPDRLRIDQIVARQPYASVIIAADATLNVARVLSPEEVNGGRRTADGDSEEDSQKEEVNGGRRSADGDESPVTSRESPPFPVSIRSVQIIDGSANFADYSIEPSFATAILELNGKVTGLSSDADSRAQVAMVGKVDRYAPVDITGEANILSAATYTDLAMNFRNMELTTFNPYSGKFAGYSISKGKLSTQLRYKVEERRLDAQHHIVVDNLEFGEKTDSKDAAPIPIKLAVALLKDRKGVIDIDLPVGGSLDDPTFRLGPIIWKALLGLLTKVVTAPFAALGALFGGGEELAFVDFDAGSAALAAAEAQKLATLAQALIERPQLKLSIPATAVPVDDGEAIARAALRARLPADEVDARERLESRETLYRTLLKRPPEYPPADERKDDAALDARIQFLEEALIAQLRPDAPAIDALAGARARAVQESLLTNAELNPERVFIVTERSGAAIESGRVRMEMKLE